MVKEQNEKDLKNKNEQNKQRINRRGERKERKEMRKKNENDKKENSWSLTSLFKFFVFRSSPCDIFLPNFTKKKKTEFIQNNYQKVGACIFSCCSVVSFLWNRRKSARVEQMAVATQDRKCKSRLTPIKYAYYHKVEFQE